MQQNDAPANPSLRDTQIDADPSLFEHPLAAPIHEQAVQMSPLHFYAAELCRTNQWMDWNDTSCVALYQDLENDYQAMRYRAGIADISALTKYLFTGTECASALDLLCTNKVSDLDVGQAMHTAFCTDDGFLIGEGMLFCLGENEYRLTTEGHHLDWFIDGIEPFKASVADTSDQIAAILLTGPKAGEVLAELGVAEEGLASGHGKWVEVAQEPVYLTRTGSLGAESFELWADVENAPLIWTRLIQRGRPLGLAPFGEVARRLARLEAGVPSIGIDYFGALDAQQGSGPVTPYEVGLSHLVDLEKEVFAGKPALVAQKKRGAERTFLGVELVETGELTLSTLYADQKPAGYITQCAWSPGLYRHIALGYVRVDALGSEGELEADAHLGPIWNKRNARLKIKIVEKPFVTY